MREIGYDGYFCYELCHPFMNDRHELRGLDGVDEQAKPRPRIPRRPAGGSLEAGSK